LPLPAVRTQVVMGVEDSDGQSGGPYLRVSLGMPKAAQICEVPPDELYLREIQLLDVSNADAIAHFVHNHGRLGLDSWGELPSIYQDPLHSTLLSQLSGRRKREVGVVEMAPMDGICPSEAEKHAFVHFNLVPVEEVALYVKLIRDMTRVWRYHQGQLTFQQVAAEWENPLWHMQPLELREEERRYQEEREERQKRDPGNLVAWQELEATAERLGWGVGKALDWMGRWSAEQRLKRAVFVPQDPEDLYAFLGEFLSAGLRAFHARPHIYRGEGNSSEEKEWGSESASLYGALCLQLANHISENADYRTCLRCGRLFYRQRGRARFGQHHTKGDAPPLYCSWSCAHAEAQAKYKRRKDAARQQAQKPGTR
jgi:hypothetical protein